jgi:nicotinamide mononucleotide transporter
MTTWFTWTPLELAANVMTAICIFLAGRNSVHTWWTGIVGSILFFVLFKQAQLYADATLQIFFLVTGIFGWMHWKSIGDKWVKSIPVTVASSMYIKIAVGSAVVVAILYGYMLHTLTDAYAPWIDSLVLTLSVVGQVLLMRKKIQTWPIWLLVNTLSVPLFWSRELYLTSILYGFFWINAIVSWRVWYNLMKDGK